ncbi:hypothetical protein RB199_15645 [Streptomyces libani]
MVDEVRHPVAAADEFTGQAERRADVPEVGEQEHGDMPLGGGCEC